MPRFALVLVLAASLAPVAAVAQTGGTEAAAAATTTTTVNAAAKADAAKAAPAGQPAAKMPPGAEVAAPKPPPGFAPVSGAAPGQPRIRATPLVVAAYLFIWAMTLLYVIYLRTRQKKVEDEIEALTRRLQKAAGE